MNQLSGLLLLFVLLILLTSPRIKGMFGEWWVNLGAFLFLDENDYRLFKNVLLRTSDGSTQIDHIIVSRYGVFVIETKNMKGWIFGDQYQKNWTQKIYKHSNQFPNPLHQNFKHTQTLLELTGIGADKVFSLVVFEGDCIFKTLMPENVVYSKDYIRYIKSKTQILLNPYEVESICSKIENHRLENSFRNRRDHVYHVKNLVEIKQRNIESNACPKCGKSLILRTAQRGENRGQQFWGCVGFPGCKFTRKLG